MPPLTSHQASRWTHPSSIPADVAADTAVTWERAAGVRHRGNRSSRFAPASVIPHQHHRWRGVGGAAVGQQLRHAVCVTGLEREYSQISQNLNRAIFGLLNRSAVHSDVRIFGVRPHNDNWTNVLRDMPFQTVATQSWNHCYPDDQPLPFWFTCSRLDAVALERTLWHSRTARKPRLRFGITRPGGSWEGVVGSEQIGGQQLACCRSCLRRALPGL